LSTIAVDPDDDTELAERFLIDFTDGTNRIFYRPETRRLYVETCTGPLKQLGVSLEIGQLFLLSVMFGQMHRQANERLGIGSDEERRTA
jgi:hypothetical protein